MRLWSDKSLTYRSNRVRTEERKTWDMAAVMFYPTSTHTTTCNPTTGLNSLHVVGRRGLGDST
jgi:hypothetical protein